MDSVGIAIAFIGFYGETIKVDLFEIRQNYVCVCDESNHNKTEILVCS